MKKLLLSLTLFLTLSTAFATEKKPNIVIFLVDDYGVMDNNVAFIPDKNNIPQKHKLNALYRTPAIEKLSKTGCRFTEFYAMSTCSPSRVSIMTGQNAARHRTTNWINPFQKNTGKYGPKNWAWEGIKSESPTLPKMLKSAGYKTIHVGKAHFAPNTEPSVDPKNIGFDVNIAGSGIGHPGSYLGKNKFTGKDKRQQVPGLGKYHNKDIFLTEALFQEAKNEVIKANNEGKPFFLNFAHYAVHTPLEADKRFINNYKGVANKQWQIFASMVESTDETLAKLIQLLEDLKIAEDTLILFLGDNGTDNWISFDNKKQDVFAIEAAAPLRGKKGTRYEGGVRVPFIASWAKLNSKNKNQQKLKIEPNSYSNGIAAIYDIMPTILNVIGAKPYEFTDGIDLSNRFGKIKADASDRFFLMHFPHEHRDQYFTTYRKGDWKIIYNYLDKTYQLYNLKDDISESNNLSNIETSKLTEMILEMKAVLTEQNALLPNI